MSFFSRKPNPPVPMQASKALSGNNASTARAQAAPLPSGAAGQVMSPAAKSEEGQAQSNSRFRSFAERYIVERCRDWKESEVDERAWETILQARSIYNKVKEVGRTLTNDN